MARVTVEDCLESMQNRFELVLVASRRARQLARGHEAHLAWENDKPTVMALREIAGGHVDASVLDEIEQSEAINAAEEAARRERDFETESAQGETAAGETQPAAEAAATDEAPAPDEGESSETPTQPPEAPEADTPDDGDAEEKGS